MPFPTSSASFNATPGAYDYSEILGAFYTMFETRLTAIETNQLALNTDIASIKNNIQTLMDRATDANKGIVTKGAAEFSPEGYQTYLQLKEYYTARGIG
jgi:hypothetical protein